jgi:hypothetical protein
LPLPDRWKCKPCAVSFKVLFASGELKSGVERGNSEESLVNLPEIMNLICGLSDIFAQFVQGGFKNASCCYLENQYSALKPFLTQQPWKRSCLQKIEDGLNSLPRKNGRRGYVPD